MSDTEHSTNAATEDTRPDDETSQAGRVHFWLGQLDASERAAKDQLEAAQEAWREYLGTFAEQPTLKGEANKQPTVRFPIFWSSVRSVQPALYSRTPVVEAQKMFDTVDDNVARIACICLERLAKYLIHSCPFDRVHYSTRDDFIVGAKATNRVMYEAEISAGNGKKYYNQVAQDAPPPPPQQPAPQGPPDPNAPPQQPPEPPPPQWLDDEGEPLPPDAELLQDKQGFYAETDEETLEKEYICLSPVSFTDILHTPNARHWEEIDWIAFKLQLTKDDVKDRFGEETAALNIYVSQEDTGTDKNEKKSLPVKYAQIWEIWDKRKKRVLWFCEQVKEDFLDEQDDPYGLDGFFPCPPFILGTLGPDNLYPSPDYIQLKPLILQLHGLAKRLKTLVRATRRRGVYDASIPELADLANDTDEAEFLAVNAYQQQIVGKGGIEQVVQYFPTEQIAELLTQMMQTFQTYQDMFNEMYGIPDIMRGTSDPTETAAAQQQKGKYLALRFSAVQREYQRLVRDGIELMCDLGLGKFSEDKLLEVMGAHHMDPEDQAVFPQALALLQDDDERKVRIDIETDSTITFNQDAEIEQRTYLGKTLTDGITAMAQAAQGAPQLVPVAGEAILYIIEGLKAGKEMEETLRHTLDQMKQAAAQPPPPPPPDPNMIRAQNEGQKIQLEHQRGMAEIQIKQQDSQTKAQAAQASAQTDAAGLQLDGAKIQSEHQTKTDKTTVEAFKAKTQEQATQFEEMIKSFEVQLDQYRAKLEERQQGLDMIKHASTLGADGQTQGKMVSIPGTPATPGHTIVVSPAVPAAHKPTAKFHKVIRDANGDMVGVHTTEVPMEPPGSQHPGGGAKSAPSAANTALEPEAGPAL